MATSSNSNIAQSVSMATKISHKSHPKARPLLGARYREAELHGARNGSRTHSHTRNGRSRGLQE